MNIFSGKQQTSTQRAHERAKKQMKDQLNYGILYYKCRRCGKELHIDDVPDIDHVMYALLEGNREMPQRISCNYFVEKNTNTLYKDTMSHNCEQGKWGVAELIGGDVYGKKYLDDKYNQEITKQNIQDINSQQRKIEFSDDTDQFMDTLSQNYQDIMGEDEEDSSTEIDLSEYLK